MKKMRKRLFTLLLACAVMTSQLFVYAESDATTTAPTTEVTPDAPVTTTPDEPVVTTPDEPVVTTPDEPVVTTPDEPVVTTPDEPVVTTPDAPAPVMVTIQDCVGQAKGYEAIVLLKYTNAGGTITYSEEASDSAGVGVIISQTVTGKVDVNTTPSINFVISTGPAAGGTEGETDNSLAGNTELVVVPDFTGKTVQGAQQPLGELIGLWHIGPERITFVASDLGKDLIVSQSVVGEVTKEVANTITFEVSLGSMITIPDYLGKDSNATQTALDALLQGLDYEIVFVQEAHETAPQGEILAQSVVGEVSTTEKITIQFTISAGPATSGEIKSYVGMSLTEALAQFASDYPNAPTPRLRYGYDNIAEDSIYMQSVTGDVDLDFSQQIYFYVSLGSYEPHREYSGSIDGGIGVGISIDGSFGDWVGKPFIYDFPEESSDTDYWEEGGMIVPAINGNILNTADSALVLPKGQYDNNVRNIISFVTDDEYVYVHIKIAMLEEGHKFSGNDFEFDLSGSSNFDDSNPLLTRFFVPDLMGGGAPANTILTVTHGTDHNASEDINQSEPIVNAAAIYTLDSNGNHSEFEMRIPISELLRQLGMEEGDEYTGISFQTRQHMIRSITAAGASTGPIIFAILALAGVSCTYFVTKKEKDLTMKQEQTA